MADLAALLERVKAAQGRDFAIDEEVFELARGRKRRRSSFEQYEPSETLPDYTGSVDAALMLVKTTLPEANCYGVEYTPQYGWEAYVSRNHVLTGHWLREGYAATAALALLVALLIALIEVPSASGVPVTQEGGNG